MELSADTLFEKIGKVFDVKAGFMISDIKRNMANNASTLKSDIENNVSTLKSDIENSAIALKSDLKADIENSASALKLVMSDIIRASHDNLLRHIGMFDGRIKEVEKAVKAVPDLVQTVHTKLSENSGNLERLGDRISHNSESIGELKASVKQMSERTAESPVNHVQHLQTGGDALSFKDAMMSQAHFSTAVLLGNSPTMIFTRELYKYVQFVTMFRNSFDQTINDSVALYEILLQHIKWPAKKAIESCIFSVPSVDRYEEAMQILEKRYG